MSNKGCSSLVPGRTDCSIDDLSGSCCPPAKSICKAGVAVCSACSYAPPVRVWLSTSIPRKSGPTRVRCKKDKGRRSGMMSGETRAPFVFHSPAAASEGHEGILRNPVGLFAVWTALSALHVVSGGNDAELLAALLAVCQETMSGEGWQRPPSGMRRPFCALPRLTGMPTASKIPMNQPTQKIALFLSNSPNNPLPLAQLSQVQTVSLPKHATLCSPANP